MKKEERDWINKTRRNLKSRYGKAPICGIYLWTHLESYKKYVGSSKNIIKRFEEHVFSIYNKPKQPFHNNVIKLGGVLSFHFKILHLCEPHERFIFEESFIKELNSFSPSGFNSAKRIIQPFNYIDEHTISKRESHYSDETEKLIKQQRLARLDYLLRQIE